jgi:hypothetical protein
LEFDLEFSITAKGTFIDWPWCVKEKQNAR